MKSIHVNGFFTSGKKRIILMRKHKAGEKQANKPFYIMLLHTRKIDKQLLKR